MDAVHIAVEICQRLISHHETTRHLTPVTVFSLLHGRFNFVVQDVQGSAGFENLVPSLFVQWDSVCETLFSRTLFNFTRHEDISVRGCCPRTLDELNELLHFFSESNFSWNPFGIQNNRQHAIKQAWRIGFATAAACECSSEQFGDNAQSVPFMTTERQDTTRRVRVENFWVVG